MDPYVCTLSAELQKKAKDELHETPERRKQDIEHIRTWIKQQRHLNAPSDDWTILRFLRGSKFSLEKTKRKMDLFYSIRSAIPEWFTNRDPQIPKILSILKRGLIIPLPKRDNNGCLVMFSRADEVPASETDIDDLMKTCYLIIDCCMEEDETTWINGVVNMVDLKNYTMAHFLAYTPPKMKKMMVLWQDGYPMRSKSMHYYNVSPVFNQMFEIFRTFMNEKMKKRVDMHGKNLESLHKAIPKEILPEELGGTDGTIASLTQYWLDKVLARRKWLMDGEKYGVDESRRPGKPKSTTDLFGLEGSFRKLEVD